ncbi:hypothetical protein EJP82_15775 [Paenibacillus anaericanus]|uniref:Nucleotide kinase n=1 Tax=Paenibacillus anaericanus TaxID=170367 RepID=A0A3S1DQS3_9BACL|nr:hypothetical protein [Paenibacillus anaericanus]RUT45143.1 hypothetical protein EJP82_15775 [Paenibacillus anaericanus]
MAEQVKHYFARGNTAEGLHSLVESVYQGLSTIYVVQGYPGGTATVLGRLASAWTLRGWNIELIHQPLESNLLEGIILEDAQLGLVDGDAWSEELNPEGTEIRYIDIRETLDTEKVAENSETITTLESEISNLYGKAYETFLRTLRIHDEWEKFYIDNLDREVMNQLAEEWGDDYLIPQLEEKVGKEIHRFLGAATSSGAVDFVPNLTDKLQTRIFVKGRPGSGKSTLFKKIANAALDRGIDTEIYHCGFDPHSLDMLIFPELSLAIFDSTAPHEHYPVREGDSILDVYELAITEGTDEKYTKEVAEVKARYTSSMKESTAFLTEAKRVKDELRGIYLDAVDEEALLQRTESLLNEIDTLVSEITSAAH